MFWIEILTSFVILSHIGAARDWNIPSKLRFDAKYPSVATLEWRQFLYGELRGI